MPVQGSTVVRRQLGRQLRRLREEAGKTVADVQEAKLFSTSKVFRIETGRTAVKVGDVRALCRFYGADDALADALATLSQAPQAGGWWWEERRRVASDWFWMYLELETTCDALFAFHPDLVHGLLQTEDYALATVSSDDPPEDTVRRRLEIRSERKLAAFGRPGKKITVVLGAAALSVDVGSTAVMNEQYRHLCDLSDGGDVDVRVLPWGAGLHEATFGSFTLLDFEDPADPAVVHVETHTGARYLEREEEIAEYRRIMTSLIRQSIPVKEFER